MTIPRMTRLQRDIRWLCLLVCTVFILTPFTLIRNAFGADACVTRAAQVVSVQGTVEVRRHQSSSWEPAVLDASLCAGDSLRVRTHSRAAIRLNNDSVMRLDQRTTITIPETEANKITALIDLIKGAVHIITRTPLPFKIRTPFLNAGVEGTEFTVALETDHARVVIFEGRVSASNEHGSVMLTSHEAAIAYPHQPPLKETIVRPLDAVQWALYYPAIIGYHRDPGSGNASNRITQAEYLLSVGQADEATTLIDHLLADTPDNSAAIALKSIIAVVQNDQDRALELAHQAVKHDDLSAPARLALSYAQQAAFDIDAALASVKQAVTLDPQNALIWARLSELHMSVGELEQALESAQEAVNLNPTIAKTQTVLGFAYLLQISTREAQSIFREAILLDQTDPMPRLGLGLALIREGQLEAGRIQLEIAASLDPGNSLIRSYLGKAYFEEKRYSLAETQFELAKKLDPLDPTPWFYDAIQKQTQNRPVEALRDIQKSIELNDNRAVYRSRLLLDQDQAGRGSSLARIYDNLGFDKRAIVETAKSLSHDPSNHSAHRFLADTYAGVPRHEAARVSELLQAQLMQPINVNPIQPRLAVADLNIITSTGPSGVGFNEFAPLMERNRSQFVTSGFVGNNRTFGNEIVFSKLYERTSVSLGQFHYQTDGFRINNDQNHDILNAFIQHAVTPRLNIQAEVRTRSSEQGNLSPDFDRNKNISYPRQSPLHPENRLRRNTDENMARIGTRYALSPKQDFIFSGIYSDTKFQNIDVAFSSNLHNTERLSHDSGYQTEAQYQFRGNRFNLLAGTGMYRIDVEQSSQNRDIRFPGRTFPCTNNCSAGNFNRDTTNGYVYSNINLSPKLNFTLGFNYGAYTEGMLDFNAFDPKFGIQWDFIKNTRLRLAWFESTKSSLAARQTLEPTQIAGFNQLFDDHNGTRSRRMGIGIDTYFADNVIGGGEISQREYVPFVGGLFEKRTEKIYRAYLYGIKKKNWVVNSEVTYEKLSRHGGLNDSLRQIDTLTMPIGVSFYTAMGISANLTGTFVRQKVDRKEGIENFFLLDTVLSYRFPNRKGFLSLEGRNLLDQNFLFHNNFPASEQIISRFVPERTVLGRITLNF